MMDSHSELMNSKVDLVPELCIAAIRSKQKPEFCCWVLLRHMNVTIGRGSGKFFRPEAIKYLAEVFEVTKARIRQVLNSGRGLFWREGNHDWMYLTGIVKLCLLLDVRRLYSSFVTVPFYYIIDTFSYAQSMLYAIGACRSKKPHAVEKMAEECDCSTRTIQRHLRAAEDVLLVRRNAVNLGSYDGPALAFEDLEKFRKQGEHPPNSMWVEAANDGSYVILRELPRTYDSACGRRSYKRLRKQAKDLRVERKPRKDPRPPDQRKKKFYKHDGVMKTYEGEDTLMLWLPTKEN